MNLSPIKRQSLIHLSCTIAVTIIGFISTMIFTHILGKEIMGVYFLFLTYVSIFNLIGDSGFGASAIKRISEGKDQNELFSAFFVLRTILLIVATLILLSIPTLFSDIQDLLPWVIIALVCAYLSNIVTVGLSAKNHLGIVSLSNGLGQITGIIFSIVFVLIGWKLFGLIGGYLIGSIVVAFYCLKLKKLDYTLTKFTKSHIKSLAVFGIWMLLINTAGTIMGYADTIFIGLFMETGDVAVYRVALSFSSGALFLASAILSTLAPKISHWSVTHHEREIAGVTSRSITWGLVIAIPIFIGGLFLAEKLLYYCYGADFASGGVACTVLLFQQVITVFLMFLGYALANSGYARQSFYGSFVAVILNVILNIIFIPNFGIIGASIASLIAIIINTIIVYVQLNNRIKIRFEYKPLLHIILANIPMIALIILISPNTLPALIITIFAGAGAYIGMLALIDRNLRKESVDVIKGLMHN